MKTGLVPEGLLNACTFNFLADDFSGKSYLMFLVTFNLFFPLTLICYFYGNIVKAVVAHEKALRAQAKKMNVESLRSNVVGVMPSDPM